MLSRSDLLYISQDLVAGLPLETIISNRFPGLYVSELKEEYLSAMELLTSTIFRNVPQGSSLIALYPEVPEKERTTLETQLRKFIPEGTSLLVSPYDLDIQVIGPCFPDQVLIVQADTYDEDALEELRDQFQSNFAHLSEDHIYVTDASIEVQVVERPTSADAILFVMAEGCNDVETDELQTQMDALFPGNEVLVANFMFTIEEQSYASLVETQEMITGYVNAWADAIQLLETHNPGNGKAIIEMLSDYGLLPSNIMDGHISVDAEWLREYKTNIEPLFIPDWSEWPLNGFAGTMAGVPLYVLDPETLNHDVLMWCI